MRRFRRFLSWQPSDRWLIIKVYFLLVAIKLGLDVLSFYDLRKLMTRWTIPGLNPVNDPLEIRRVVEAVEIASRHTPGKSTCLVKALAGHLMLARRNIPVELYIGVRQGKTGQLDAHAWVSHQGQVIIGEMEDLDGYVPMSSPSMRVI